MTPASLLKRLDRACREAVRLHGSDWTQVNAHIARHLEQLSPDDRRKLDAAVSEDGRGQRLGLGRLN